jgi:hypothetical protein
MGNEQSQVYDAEMLKSKRVEAIRKSIIKNRTISALEKKEVYKYDPEKIKKNMQDECNKFRQSIPEMRRDINDYGSSYMNLSTRSGCPYPDVMDALTNAFPIKSGYDITTEQKPENTPENRFYPVKSYQITVKLDNMLEQECKKEAMDNN